MTLRFTLTTTYYPPFHLGGDALHVYQLAQLLAEGGHSVNVIAIRDYYAWKRAGPMPGDFPNHPNVQVHWIERELPRLRTLAAHTFGTFATYVLEAEELIARQHPDVLHHHNIAGFGPDILTVQAPRTLWTQHDYWPFCQRNNLVRWNGVACDVDYNCTTCATLGKKPPQLWRTPKGAISPRSPVQTVITPSRYMAEQVTRHMTEKPVTLPNFVPSLAINANKRKEQFLFVGVLESHKGILSLLRDFQSYPGTETLQVVGDGSLREDVRKIAEQDSRVNVLGRVDDQTLSDLMSNSKLFMFPSSWPENCPLVILEALAAGTPVVGTNLGGTPELLSSEYGVLYNPHLTIPWDDVKSLLGRWDSASRAALDTYNSRFSRERFLADYLAICANVGGKS